MREPFDPNVCQRKGCGKPSATRPVLLLYPPGQPEFHEPIRATVTLPLCRACADETTVEDLVGDAGWAAIEAMCKSIGRVVPDRQTILLEWDS